MQESSITRPNIRDILISFDSRWEQVESMEDETNVPFTLSFSSCLVLSRQEFKWGVRIPSHILYKFHLRHYTNVSFKVIFECRPFVLSSILGAERILSKITGIPLQTLHKFHPKKCTNFFWNNIQIPSLLLYVVSHESYKPLKWNKNLFAIKLYATFFLWKLPQFLLLLLYSLIFFVFSSDVPYIPSIFFELKFFLPFLESFEN